jgi:hypothetical protein
VGLDLLLLFIRHLIAAEGQVEGVAWLEQDSGLPVELTTAVTSVPFKEDGVKITAYRETNHFSLSDGGDCFLTQTQIEMKISAWGFKRQVKTHQRFTHHWLWQGGGDG